MKTKAVKKIDYDSVENQSIKGQFVERQVKACFSYEMEAILGAGENGNKDLPWIDEIENYYEYKCPECDAVQSEPFDSEAIDKDDERFDSPMKYKCYECNKEFTEDPEQVAQEIYEWWIVSEFFYKKLKAKGHPVLEWGNNYYWGRCTTGQAIKLDGVVSEICEEMEILDGQKNSWGAK